jgi:hypothetical protein
MTGAPLKDITHLRKASGGPARQRQILEGTRWILLTPPEVFWEEELASGHISQISF